MAEQAQANPLPDFGEPIDKDLLLGFANITAADKASAVRWWDENASEEWRGALENKPIKKRK
jgi:hypothetical protein